MWTVREAKATQVYPITCAGANIKDLDAANSSNTHIGNIKGFSQVKRLSFVINNRYGICLLDPYTSKDGYYNHQIVLNIHERNERMKERTCGWEMGCTRKHITQLLQPQVQMRA